MTRREIGLKRILIIDDEKQVRDMLPWLFLLCIVGINDLCPVNE